MPDAYEVPKHEVPARVVLPGSEPRDARLFLSERAERHTGRERPGDLLNGGQPFFPVSFADTGFALLRRSSVLVVTVRAEDELVAGATDGQGIVEDGADADGAERQELRLVLERGPTLEGTITYLMPPGERRLQDYLNQADDFVRLRRGDRIHLVNTARIALVEPA